MKRLSTLYSYFGARYYDSDLSVWLSVDPMADQRSWVSPYNYCQWNPLNRLDPTGALDEEEPETNIVLVIRNSNEEYQQAKNGNNAGDYDNWHVIVATDIVDGQKQLKEYLGESKADNLIVSCHGYTSGLSLTEPYTVSNNGEEITMNELSIGDIQQYNRTGSGLNEQQQSAYNALNELSGYVNDNGAFVFTACFAGEQGLAKEAYKGFNQRINYYANSDYGEVVGKKSGKVQMGSLTSGKFINQKGEYIGNIEIQDNSQKPIIINKNYSYWLIVLFMMLSCILKGQTINRTTTINSIINDAKTNISFKSEAEWDSVVVVSDFDFNTLSSKENSGRQKYRLYYNDKKLGKVEYDSNTPFVNKNFTALFIDNDSVAFYVLLANNKDGSFLYYENFGVVLKKECLNLFFASHYNTDGIILSSFDCISMSHLSQFSTFPVSMFIFDHSCPK